MTIYLEHFGLAEAPFKITPHTEFFFEGAARGETLDGLIYAITSGEGMVKVTGEVGAGKTMLCRVLMERLPDSVETIYLAVPSLSRDEMLAVIAQDLGIDTSGISTTQLVRALQEKLIATHAEGCQVVALIDEAHAMPLATLEEIRLLSNLETSHHKLMQIVLFGQPELDAHLSLPHMRQLKERITHSFVLRPLPPRDIKDYLNFRLRAAGYKGPDLFSADALKLITDASEGLTRRINIYADKTLLAAYAGGTHTITADHVRAAVADTAIVLPAEQQKRERRGLALAAGVLLGAAVGFLAGRFTAPAAVQPVASAVAPAPASIAPSAEPVLVAAQAPSGMAAAAPATATPAPVAASTPPPAPQAPAESQRAEGFSQRMQQDREKLEAMVPNQLAIQLMTADAREVAAIEAFVKVADNALGRDRVVVTETAAANVATGPRVSVVYGPFVERNAALQALSRLPTATKRFTPYLRTIQAIRDDARVPAATMRVASSMPKPQ